MIKWELHSRSHQQISANEQAHRSCQDSFHHQASPRFVEHRDAKSHGDVACRYFHSASTGKGLLHDRTEASLIQNMPRHSTSLPCPNATAPAAGTTQVGTIYESLTSVTDHPSISSGVSARCPWSMVFMHNELRFSSRIRFLFAIQGLGPMSPYESSFLCETG